MPVVRMRSTVREGPGSLRRKSLSRSAEEGVQRLTGLMSKDQFFHFREPIEVRQYREGGLWWHEYKRLGIVGYGKTLAESWDSLIEHFVAYWERIANESDSRLTESARDYKRTLLALVDAVKPVL